MHSPLASVRLAYARHESNILIFLSEKSKEIKEKLDSFVIRMRRDSGTDSVNRVCVASVNKGVNVLAIGAEWHSLTALRRLFGKI